jgi:glycosyltransferase involved in cell wall biosynthesis
VQKISIITVCYNCEKTILDTLNSVANQENVDVEHIIIDGASTDNTIKIIQAHQGHAKLISEPDKGIYDAMNKGIGLANGDIIGFLNADDIYMSKSVLSIVEKTFLNPDIKACFADLVYVKQNDINTIVRFWQSKPYKIGDFKNGWVPAHPTFFARKSEYAQLGGFNLSYKIAADFEILFRFIEVNNIETQYIPQTLVKMRLGGTTNSSFSNIYKQNKEIIKILRNHYADFNLLSLILQKTKNRLKQFFFRPSN